MGQCKEAVEEKGIPELLRIYVKFHEEAEKDDTNKLTLTPGPFAISHFLISP